MKQHVKKLLWIVLLVLSQTNLITAQTVAQYEKAADEYFAKKEYYNAMHYYDIVLQSKKTTDVYYKYAEAARLSYAYLKAEEAYDKVVKSREKSQYPMVEYYYGMTLKHNAKYDEAKRAFKYFKNNYSKDNFYKEKAEQEYKSCDVAKRLAKKQIPKDSLEISHLGKHVNTEYSDFGAHEVDGELYYSSLRFERVKEKGEKREKTISKRLISKLLKSKDEKKGDEIDKLNNKSEHSANSCLSPDGKRLYFTRCNGKSSDSLRCELYVSERLDNGEWSAPERLPNPINSNVATTTHPHVMVDDSNKEWLYFVSDRSGGLGGMDIWRVELKADGTAYEPLNLGVPINSKDAEITPFYDTRTKRLYFSSQWHYGLGGYDIFYCTEVNGEWTDPVNAGVPFNSAANDLYFVINEGDTTGYFASNREGSRTLTKESCCNDIYAYKYPKKQLPPPDTTVQDTPVVVVVDPPVIDTPVVDTPPTVVVVDPPKKDTTPVFVETPPPPPLDDLNDLLPLRLYFHNDEPDSNTTVRTTNTPYEESYQHYLSLADKYKMEYSSQFNPERGVYAKDDVERFFMDDVRGEYNRSQDFLDKLAKVLKTGAKLKLYIRGYTSPRAPERYNVALAGRRVASMKSFILRYQNNLLQPYVNNGQLVITEALLGESLAPAGISDDYNDPKNSIYGIDASKERKAEISVVKLQ